jgi:rubrerythrin
MYYTGQEIIEIAVRIEENGFAFYTTAAQILKGPNDIKNLFLDLAEKEVHHTNVFQKLAEKFEGEKFEFNKDESSDYIAFLADSHLFGKKDAGAEMAKTIKTPKEALEIAFKFENDSVAFYEALFKRTESDAKKLILKIINEEKSHAAEIKRFM